MQITSTHGGCGFFKQFGQVYMHLIDETKYYIKQIKICASTNNNEIEIVSLYSAISGNLLSKGASQAKPNRIPAADYQKSLNEHKNRDR